MHMGLCLAFVELRLDSTKHVEAISQKHGNEKKHVHAQLMPHWLCLLGPVLLAAAYSRHLFSVF